MERKCDEFRGVSVSEILESVEYLLEAELEEKFVRHLEVLKEENNRDTKVRIRRIRFVLHYLKYLTEGDRQDHHVNQMGSLLTSCGVEEFRKVFRLIQHERKIKSSKKTVPKKVSFLCSFLFSKKDKNYIEENNHLWRSRFLTIFIENFLKLNKKNLENLSKFCKKSVFDCLTYYQLEYLKNHGRIVDLLYFQKSPYVEIPPKSFRYEYRHTNPHNLSFVYKGDNEQELVCQNHIPPNFYFSFVDLGQGYAISNDPQFRSQHVVYYKGKVMCRRNIDRNHPVLFGEGYLIFRLYDGKRLYYFRGKETESYKKKVMYQDLIMRRKEYMANTPSLRGRGTYLRGRGGYLRGRGGYLRGRGGFWRGRGGFWRGRGRGGHGRAITTSRRRRRKKKRVKRKFRSFRRALYSFSGTEENLILNRRLTICPGGVVLANCRRKVNLINNDDNEKLPHEFILGKTRVVFINGKRTLNRIYLYGERHVPGFEEKFYSQTSLIGELFGHNVMISKSEDSYEQYYTPMCKEKPFMYDLLNTTIVRHRKFQIGSEFCKLMSNIHDGVTVYHDPKNEKSKDFSSFTQTYKQFIIFLLMMKERSESCFSLLSKDVIIHNIISYISQVDFLFSLSVFQRYFYDVELRRAQKKTFVCCVEECQCTDFLLSSLLETHGKEKLEKRKKKEDVNKSSTLLFQGDLRIMKIATVLYRMKYRFRSCRFIRREVSRFADASDLSNVIPKARLMKSLCDKLILVEFLAGRHEREAEKFFHRAVIVLDLLELYLSILDLVPWNQKRRRRSVEILEIMTRVFSICRTIMENAKEPKMTRTLKYRMEHMPYHECLASHGGEDLRKALSGQSGRVHQTNDDLSVVGYYDYYSDEVESFLDLDSSRRRRSSRSHQQRGKSGKNNQKKK